MVKLILIPIMIIAAFWIAGGLVVSPYIWVIPFVLIYEWLTGPYRRAAAMRQRADQQHAALLEGDETLGVYGAYPPASLE